MHVCKCKCTYIYTYINNIFTKFKIAILRIKQRGTHLRQNLISYHPKATEMTNSHNIKLYVKQKYMEYLFFLLQ